LEFIEVHWLSFECRCIVLLGGSLHNFFKNLRNSSNIFEGHWSLMVDNVALRRCLPAQRAL